MSRTVKIECGISFRLRETGATIRTPLSRGSTEKTESLACRTGSDGRRTRGLHKIKVRIDVEKFKRYETKLKQLSADGIIFDIIQDDDDIRDSYSIDGDPDQIRSYLMQYKGSYRPLHFGRTGESKRA